MFFCNIVVPTKITQYSFYKEVAVNKFPVVIDCLDIESCKQILRSKSIQQWIKEHIPHDNLRGKAKLCIRSILPDTSTRPQQDIEIFLQEL